MLRHWCSLLDHLLQKFVFDWLRVLLDNLNNDFFVLVHFLVFSLVVSHNFLLELTVEILKSLQVLHVSFSSFYEWFWLNAESLGCLVGRENIHRKHLRLSFEDVLVLWQVTDRDHLSHVSAVGARNLHDVLVALFAQLCQASLAKCVSALQNSWNFQLSIVRECAYLAFDLLVVTLLILSHIPRLFSVSIGANLSLSWIGSWLVFPYALGFRVLAVITIIRFWIFKFAG